jgi:hypothetical protein
VAVGSWAAISAISTALSAAASFAAVITALWLARGADRPKLSIEAVIGLKLDPLGPSDFVIVEIANTGARAENITSVWFRAGGHRARMLFELSSSDDSDELPTKLEPGETARFLYDPLIFLRDIGRAEEFIRKRRPFGRKLNRRIFVGAQTVTNFTVASKVSPILQALFETGNANLFVSLHLSEKHPAYAHIQRGVRGFFSTRNLP